MAITRYVKPSAAPAAPAAVADNDPAATAAANAAAVSSGQLSFSGPATPAATPAAPPAPTISDAQLTGVNGAKPTDPVAAYYANLADPAVADQPIKDQIQKNMQSALDAIDQKYVSIYAQNAVDNTNRTGQTRAENSRGGLLGSDFGDENFATTDKINKGSTAAIDNARSAEKSAIQVAANGQLVTLATNEVNAKKADALGQAQNAQAILNKNQESARTLIPQLAASGATLTPEQKDLLKRNSGYDDLTFDTLYNSSQAAANKIDYKFETVKNGDGSTSLLKYGIDPKTGQLVEEKYDVPGSANITDPIKEYGGRPYTESKDANGNIKLIPVAGYIQPKAAGSASDSVAAQSAAFTLKVKQAPAQVANLAKQGYDWGQIATYFQQQGIDPGTAEIDDSLHRQFSSSGDYQTWKKEQQASSKANASDLLLQTLLGK